MNITSIKPPGSFHYPLVDKLDTYAGILLGYNIVTSKEIGDPTGGYGMLWPTYSGHKKRALIAEDSSWRLRESNP